MSANAFYSSVTHAQIGCQLVEQELKLYITEAFDLVRTFWARSFSTLCDVRA